MKNNKTTQKRIARRLIIAMVLFSSLITIFTSAIQLYGYYERDVNAIEQHLSQIETVYMSNIASNVWVGDKEEMLTQLSGLLNLQDIVYTEVTEQGKLWIKAGMMQTENKIEKIYPIYYTHRDKKRHIADLYVQASLNEVYQNLINEIWNILISNGIKTFLVTGFMFLLFQYLVTRHLHQIAAFASKLTVKNLDSQLSLERKKRSNYDDELDVVVNAMQRMQANLAESIKDIKEREARLSIYEKIMSTTSDQMAFVDKNYTYLAVNQAYCEMFDKKYEDIVNHTVTDLLGSEYFEKVVKERMDQVFQGQHFLFESVVETPGKSVPVEITYTPYYGESNEVQGAVVNVRNISERIRHHNVYRALARAPAIDFSLFLKDSLKLLVDVFDARFAMVGRLNDDKTKVVSEALYMNNQIVDNITYDLKGTPCNEVINSGSKIIINNVSDKFPDDDMLIEFGIKSYFGSALMNTEGEKIGLVLVMDDKSHAETDWYEDTLSVVAARISMEMERADALRALDEHRKNLEIEIGLRTADLQRANEELESFAYSVSHDLRTPLRAINGFTHILDEDKTDLLDEEGHQLLSKIRSASERMGGLIDSLLSLSRIRRHEIDVCSVNISSLCQTIIDDLVDTYDMDRVHFDIQENIKVEGDSMLLKIVLENLIMNALKFSVDKEKPEIKIGAEKHNNTSVIYVKDNGVGFDMSFKDKLFKPFQRLHKEDEFSGYGIGLATVFRIIERHGGNIWAESILQEGTTVYFELPDKN